MPSFTINWTTYVPLLSVVKVGLIEVGLVSVAWLAVGTLTNDQAYVSGLPSTSVEPLPFSSTSVCVGTVWLGPAFATGAESCVVITTWLGVLLW
jgi:hypothetical protein